MPVFNPQIDPAALKARLSQDTGLAIVCFCAAWCDTCTKYRADFEALALKWPEHAFVWIDIEENAEFLGEEDVENFPTVLIQSPTANLFFGALLPFISHLDRLIGSIDASAPATEAGPPLLQSRLSAAP